MCMKDTFLLDWFGRTIELEYSQGMLKTQWSIRSSWRHFDLLLTLWSTIGILIYCWHFDLLLALWPIVGILICCWHFDLLLSLWSIGDVLICAVLLQVLCLFQSSVPWFLVCRFHWQMTTCSRSCTTFSTIRQPQRFCDSMKYVNLPIASTSFP